MIREIAKWHVFFPNEAFLVVKSTLGSHGANPPHIYMTQEKSANFAKQAFSMKPELDWV
jgi:hypothetical protein